MTISISTHLTTSRTAPLHGSGYLEDQGRPLRRPRNCFHQYEFCKILCMVKVFLLIKPCEQTTPETLKSNSHSTS